MPAASLPFPPMPNRPPERPRPARRRRGAVLTAAVLAGCLCAPGCAALRQKWDAAIATDVDHPAVPAKPVRIPGAVVSADPGPAGLGPTGDVTLASADAGGGVRTADAGSPAAGSPAPGAPRTPATGPPPHFDDGDVVAVVNGEPLFAGDLLQFEVQLNQAAANIAAAPDAADLPPGDPRGLTAPQRAILNGHVDAERARLLAGRLPAKIDEALLAQRMRRTLKAEQLEQLNGAVVTLFDQAKLPEMLRKANAQAAAAGGPPIETKAELQRLMLEQGLDYAAVVADWKPQQMAMAYVEQRTGMGSIRVSRREVKDYYDAHLADFTPPRAARWEQIVVPYEHDGAKAVALDVVEVAAGDLRRGRTFAEVATDYSRGPNAKAGGRWDWTAPEAVPDRRVAAAVWEQAPGEVGAVLDCPLSEDGFPPGGAYKIVRVLERRGEGPPPLEDLREKIEALIKSERRQQTVSDLLAEERAAAQIEVYVPGTAWPPER